MHFRRFSPQSSLLSSSGSSQYHTYHCIHNLEGSALPRLGPRPSFGTPTKISPRRAQDLLWLHHARRCRCLFPGRQNSPVELPRTLCRVETLSAVGGCMSLGTALDVKSAPLKTASIMRWSLRAVQSH